MENADRHKAVRRRRPNDRYCRRLRSRFLVLTEQAQSAPHRRGTVQGRRFVVVVIAERSAVERYRRKNQTSPRRALSRVPS
jgi:hypothetical protein